ncbi:MAG: alcohol dehydrogenase-like regulatory protein ErcA [Methanoregulaceae archaeon]
MFGEGARHLAGRYARSFQARNVLVVTDPTIRRISLFEDVCKSLEDSGIRNAVYDGVVPNPRVENVMKGAEQYEKEECSGIVAIGGGSPMDCAKGIGIVISNHQNIVEFEGVDRIAVPPPPLICIPTTAGSSADVSQFAIITDPPRKMKMAIISKVLVPDVALIDPETLLTLPADLTAATGMDTLVHAIEAYVSNASSPITDLFALEAVRLVAQALPRAIQDPANPGYRRETMLASLYAGLAFSNASLGAVHALAHALGGYRNLPHGTCNALLLESVIEANYPAAAERFASIAEAVGIPNDDCRKTEMPGQLLRWIHTFRTSVGASGSLARLDVTPSDIAALAAIAIRDPCMVTNPKDLTLREIEAIYAAAL